MLVVYEMVIDTWFLELAMCKSLQVHILFISWCIILDKVF